MESLIFRLEFSRFDHGFKMSKMKRYFIIAIISAVVMGCSPLFYNNTLEYTEDFPQTAVSCFDSVSVSKDAFMEMISNIDTCIIRYDGEMHLLADGLSHALNEAWWHYRWKVQYDTDRDSVKLWDSSTVTFRSFLDVQDRPLYYIGRLNLSDDFDSYLIASSDLQSVDDYPLQVFNYIYIVNIKDDKFSSMVKLWSAEFCAIAPQFTYTAFSNSKIFRQREMGDFCMSDVIVNFSIWSPDTWFLGKPTHGIRFRFNSDGKVEIL